jgi:hypothetical protein
LLTVALDDRRSASTDLRVVNVDDDEPIEVVWPQGSGAEAEGQGPDGSGVKEQDYSISEFRNILGQVLEGYTVTTWDNKQVQVPALLVLHSAGKICS